MNRKEKIISILERYPETRNNDNELTYRYLKECNMPTDYEYLRNLNYNIADSISRIRRKAQESNPLLFANQHTKANRTKSESEIKEWARRSL